MARTNFPTFSSFFFLIVLFTTVAEGRHSTITIPPGANQLGAKVFNLYACSKDGNFFTDEAPFLNRPLAPGAPVSLICTISGANKTIAEGKTGFFGFVIIKAAPGSMADVALPDKKFKVIPCYMDVTPTSCPALTGKTVTSPLMLVGVYNHTNTAVLIIKGLPSTAA